MGLDKASLPDEILKRISPEDRKAAGLPQLFCESVTSLQDNMKKAATKADVKREKELQTQIIQWLRLRNITPIFSAIHRPTSNNVGCPDILFAVQGRAVALEAKLPGCKPTDDQRRFMDKLICDGWICRIVHSLDEARAVVAEVEHRQNASRHPED